MMTHRFTALLLLPLLLLTACTVGEDSRMAHVLAEADSQNQAYDSITGVDSLVLATHYYDRHGTPNERMRAHYLLGCAYRDMGEAPRALATYQNAADCANTVATDCDYRTLCRVYSQMAELFYKQNLLDDDLRCLDKSIEYAYKANDTIAAISLYGQKVGTYDKRHTIDSIISVSTQTYLLFSQIGYPEVGSRYLSFAVKGYTQKQEYDQARYYMDIYECKSGFFDSLGNIEKGREAYYGIKGRYYLAIGKFDSAKTYLNRQLHEGRDFNNQNMASHWLAQLYQKTGMTDSSAKYALYAYDMNDSTYSQATTEALAQMQASYDYSSHQRLAHQKEQEADLFKTTLIVVCSLSAIMILLFIIAYIRYRDEKQRLRDRIQLLRGYAANKNLYDSPIAQHFRQLLKANPYQNPSLSDWKELKTVISREIPDFHEKLQTDSCHLSDNEYDICLLIKIQTSCSDIARLKQCTPSYVTQIRKSVYQRLFNKAGKADDLDEYIMSLS